MQYLPITEDLTLSELTDIVGERNVSSILAANHLKRTPNIGKQFQQQCDDALAAGASIDVIDPESGELITVTSDEVSWQRKYTMLNAMSGSADTFEHAALMGEDDWVVYNNLGTFPGMLAIPETVSLPDTTSTGDLLGSYVPIAREIHQAALAQLSTAPHIIDPEIFNEYSTAQPTNIADRGLSVSAPMEWFNLPWGEITLYSSISNTSMDFPVYPEEYEDGRQAAYEQMPDMIYQYEPWQVYKSSGPRTNNFTFDMHRDMWTGDHRDGKCNELIRFCEANCYPEYKGSAVNTSIVTLYVHGSPLIRGVLTAVNVKWDGPIGLDGWYLHCVVSLTIVEVSDSTLDYNSVMSKPLIG